MPNAKLVKRLAKGLAAFVVMLSLAVVPSLVATPPAQALQADELLEDPALEERARDISAQLRCMVCQNESIDESNADLARDLRLLVRERLVAGDTNAEVIDFMVARYGEFVLLNPRVGWHTMALWGAPIVFLLFGGLIAARFFRAHSAAARTAGGQPEALSEDESKRLAEILKRDA